MAMRIHGWSSIGLVLAELNDSALMAMHAALLALPPEVSGAAESDLFDRIAAELGKRDAIRYCPMHFSVLIHPDGCQHCFAEGPGADVIPIGGQR
jgi:hypothetical protein